MRVIVLTAAMLLQISNAFSQTHDSIPKIIFGFNVGLNYTNVQLENVLPGVQYANSAGFRMGLLMDGRLSKHLSFSPKAELSFNDSRVIVLQSSSVNETYEVYPVLMEFAAHLNYRILSGKTTPYLLFGPSYKIPLTGNTKFQYATKRSGISLDFGIGLDKKTTFFNIAPEIRYSLGLMNLSGITAVGKLYFHSLTLVLNFKG